MKLRKVLALALAGTMTLGLVGCGGNAGKSSDSGEKKEPDGSQKIQDVTLNVWAPEDEQKVLQTMCDEFVTANKDKVNLTVKLSTQAESDADSAVLVDIEKAADIFALANNQIKKLADAGALLEIPKDTYGDIWTRNTSGSIQACSLDNKLYAFPRTADNGYFLYYNTKYFTAEDVKSMETIIPKAAKLGKKVSIELNSGWYLYGFFRAAGLNTTVDENGNTKCNYNSKTNKYKGVDVASALLNLVKQKSIITTNNDSFELGINDGTIIAGISGTWNATKVEKAWGENYAATKLPTYKVAGDDLQMYSVAGCKVFGVNAKTKSQEWALKLTDWLTNEQNQIKFCEDKGSGPSNIKAAEAKVVQDNPALAAVAMQQQWSEVQYVGDNYWVPSQTFGEIISGGNKDNTDLQKLLDDMVTAVEAPIKK